MRTKEQFAPEKPINERPILVDRCPDTGQYVVKVAEHERRFQTIAAALKYGLAMSKLMRAKR